jgi:hypothetical protein
MFPLYVLRWAKPCTNVRVRPSCIRLGHLLLPPPWGWRRPIFPDVQEAKWALIRMFTQLRKQGKAVHASPLFAWCMCVLNLSLCWRIVRCVPSSRESKTSQGWIIGLVNFLVCPHVRAIISRALGVQKDRRTQIIWLGTSSSQERARRQKYLITQQKRQLPFATSEGGLAIQYFSYLASEQWRSWKKIPLSGIEIRFLRLRAEQGRVHIHGGSLCFHIRGFILGMPIFPGCALTSHRQQRRHLFYFSCAPAAREMYRVAFASRSSRAHT